MGLVNQCHLEAFAVPPEADGEAAGRAASHQGQGSQNSHHGALAEYAAGAVWHAESGWPSSVPAL